MKNKRKNISISNSLPVAKMSAPRPPPIPSLKLSRAGSYFLFHFVIHLNFLCYLSWFNTSPHFPLFFSPNVVTEQLVFPSTHLHGFYALTPFSQLQFFCTSSHGKGLVRTHSVNPDLTIHLLRMPCVRCFVVLLVWRCTGNCGWSLCCCSRQLYIPCILMHQC